MTIEKAETPIREAREAGDHVQPMSHHYENDLLDECRRYVTGRSSVPPTSTGVQYLLSMIEELRADLRRRTYPTRSSGSQGVGR